MFFHVRAIFFAKRGVNIILQDIRESPKNYLIHIKIWPFTNFP